MALNDKGKFGVDMGEVFDREDKRTRETPATPLPRRRVKEAQKERLQLTIQPTLKAALQAYADNKDTTMNKVVLEILTDFLRKNSYL